ncbi:MAG: TatD family hydrolase [Candidatus Omnitrophota bacterium]
MMNLIDTHAHLDGIDDVRGALKRAESAGVRAIVAVGENKAANQKNLDLARNTKRPEIILALGLHPGKIESDLIDEELLFIEKHLGEAKAIGEIGLDFWYKETRKDSRKKEEQLQVYRRLLEIARDNALPVLIHTRGAWREAFEMAKSVCIQRAVFHWYSGPMDVLKDILDKGYFISASPSVVYSEEARNSLEFAPVEQTLVETDSPVFYKHCEGGLKAEPKDVFVTLKHYALLKKRSEQELAEILNKNAELIFNLD